MISPEDFLDIVQPSGPTTVVRFGKVSSDYSSGDPKILFEGEASAGTRTFPHLASYTPAANDRVALLPTEHGFLILGKF